MKRQRTLTWVSSLTYYKRRGGLSVVKDKDGINGKLGGLVSLNSIGLSVGILYFDEIINAGGALVKE